MADGFEMLTADHREVEGLFDTYRHDSEDSVAHEICERLSVHTRMEEDRDDGLACVSKHCQPLDLQIPDQMGASQSSLVSPNDAPGCGPSAASVWPRSAWRGGS